MSMTLLTKNAFPAESLQLAEALASTLSAAATKNEANKTATVDAGLGQAVQHVLSLPDLPGSAVVAVCDLLRRCCNADDDRPVVSRYVRDHICCDAMHLQCNAFIQHMAQGLVYGGPEQSIHLPSGLVAQRCLQQPPTVLAAHLVDDS